MVFTDRRTVWRFLTCFQNEGTQRVYLAAWRKAHVLCTFPRPWGNCPMLRDVRKGLRMSRPIRSERSCIRKEVFSVFCAPRSHQAIFAPSRAVCLRMPIPVAGVPRELLGQVSPCSTHARRGTNTIRFGPILRGRTDQSACILAPCVCKGSDPLICLHRWALWCFKRFGTFLHRQLFVCGLWHFSGALREDLRSIRFPPGSGAARDTL